MDDVITNVDNIFYLRNKIYLMEKNKSKTIDGKLDELNKELKMNIQKLNENVYAIYGLSENEINIIEKSMCNE